ncbi:MAG: hypothetical protein NC099_02595 [Corallococcus sp.]|nr:hypothetical protein [Corallococcus sp.]
MALNKLQLSELLSVYGAMLTEKQREAVSMYCDCDCSLGEIADELGITRQGVRDAVVKAEAALVKLEAALHLRDFYRDVNAAINGDDGALKEIVKQFVSKE